MQRTNYRTPNPKHAFTFAFVSIIILMLPLFWSPVNEQGALPAAPATGVAEHGASPAVGVQLPTTPSAGFQGPVQTPALVSSATPGPAQTPASAESANDFTNDSSVTRPHQDPTVEFSAQLRHIVVALLVTTVLIGVTLKLMQKHIPGMGGKTTPTFLNILAREAIGPNQSLALVKVGPKILVVGLCEHSMTTLCELAEADLEALIPGPSAEPVDKPTASKVYGDVLRHYLSIVPGMGGKK